MKFRLTKFGADIRLIAGLAGGIQQGNAQLSVGPVVHVSVADKDVMMTEVTLAAHPTDSSRLLACAFRVPEGDAFAQVIVAYLSTDGGKTWTPTYESKPRIQAGDPTCVFGPDGIAYYAGMEWDYARSMDREGVVVVTHRSLDGGRTWSRPFRLPFFERPWLVVDQSSEKRRGRVYLYGNGSDPNLSNDSAKSYLTLYHSTDRGQSYGSAIRRNAFEAGEAVWGQGSGVVLSDGTLLMPIIVLENYDGHRGPVAPDAPNASLRILSSADGGMSLSPAVVVSDWWLTSTAAPLDLSSSPIPSLAVDVSQSPFRDRVYLVWPDARLGRNDILFSYSADKGKTWSPPVFLDEGRPWPPETPGDPAGSFMPVIAVNKHGIVGVMWYDRKDRPSNLGWTVRFQASLDGGDTWLPSIPLPMADQSVDVTRQLMTAAHTGLGEPRGQPRQGTGPVRVRLNPSVYQFSGGHTAGLVADAAGAFHPLWIANPTGIPQVWTTHITVDGKATPNGSAELATLTDVTSIVEVEILETGFSWKTQVARLKVRLKNVSNRVLAGPLVARLTGARSGLSDALPKALNGENDRSSAGAIWRFNVGESQVLPPGQSSSAKEMLFRLSGVEPADLHRRVPRLTRFDLSAGMLVDLDLRILGSVRPERRP